MRSAPPDVEVSRYEPSSNAHRTPSSDDVAGLIEREDVAGSSRREVGDPAREDAVDERERVAAGERGTSRACRRP